MLASGDYAVTQYEVFNPPAICAPYSQRPNEQVGLLSGFSRSNQSFIVSDVFFFSEEFERKAFVQNQGEFSDASTLWSIRHRQEKAFAESTMTWKRFVFDPNASTDVDSIAETVDSVFDMIGMYGASSINFGHLDSKSVNGEHLATVLRVTSSYRDQVQGWDEALGAAIESLTIAEVDYRDALAGLL